MAKARDIRYIARMDTQTALPANWTLMLEQIESTLTEAIQVAHSRETALAERAGAEPSPISLGIPADHLEGLDRRVKEMETRLLTLDQTLQGEEEDTRRHLAMVADVRHKVAGWKMI